ncbi:MAG TPA: nicotinate-nucleotide--dimethylbenzimidazole phosphoribosyltransferase [Actinomycetota bacterium]|nr:nicotinate-nucleotide--dimethylbenzimidazole phosphoribosyltransferase [Actinomycetota bacterium]
MNHDGYFDAIVSELAAAPGPDAGAMAAVAERAERVLRPAGAFARLDGIATWLAGWQRSDRPAVRKPAAIVFVADHGVVTEGVSAYPAAVTAAMHRALTEGAATASVMAATLGVTLRVVDVGVGRPTNDLTSAPALDQTRFAECFGSGRAAVAELAGGDGVDLLVLGEMGIGNTTAAAAICACLSGLPAGECTGRGTGLDAGSLERKVAAVERARTRVGEARPLEVLRQVGGSELASLAGAACEARLRSIPVVLDGFVVTAALAALEAEAPGALDNCLAGHRSSEPGHGILLDKLGKQPLLDLGLRLGEGSGALLAVPLVALAARTVVEVATFEEWGLG